MDEGKEPLPSRRFLLHTIAAAPALAVAGGQLLAQQHAAHGSATTGVKTAPFVRRTFSDRQWRTVQVLCDLILPADGDSPSATAAAVPEFIDDWIAFRKEEDRSDRLEAQIFGGLNWLDMQSQRVAQKEFAAAPLAVQTGLLDRIAWHAKAAPADLAYVAFFNAFRNMTMSGFFSSKAGVRDLPYLGNRAIATWKGCDPKVWAIVEERLKNGYQEWAARPNLGPSS